MAITASGVGSGLDIENIVSQLMTLERQPLVALQRKESEYKAQLSSYGRLKSAISSFKDAMGDLGDVEKFKVFSSTSSNEDVLTATTTSAAAGGIYGLDVTPTQVASNALRALGEMFAAIYVNPEVFKLLRG